MIVRAEILMGRDAEFPLDKKAEENLSTLLCRLNEFRKAYARPMIVSSGYRPGHYNKSAGGARNSAHLTCEACDFQDRSGVLKRWIEENPDVLERCDLYMEHPDATPTWVHLQTRPTKNRIFKP